MTERKYSVSEIDKMREAILRLYPLGVPYRANERAADAENRLRTHMQNGTGPEELERAAREHVEKGRAARAKLDAALRQAGVPEEDIQKLYPLVSAKP